MKKSISIFILGLTLISLISCADYEDYAPIDEKEVVRVSNQTLRVYNNIVYNSHIREQNLIANQLSAIEKYSIWQLKLDNFKQKNDLNRAQKDYIDFLRRIISVDIFNDSTSRKRFNNKFKDQVYDRAVELFGFNLGNYLLTNVENVNQTLEKLDGNLKSPNTSINERISICDCETKNNNTANQTCRRLTGVSIYGLSWEYGSCGGTCVANTVSLLSYIIWETDDDGRCSFSS